MRLSRWTTLASALAALALGAGCQRSSGKYGSEGSKDQGRYGASTSAQTEVQGTVTQKSGDQLKISDASGQQRTVRTDDRTQIFVGGQKTSGLEQIQEGSQVRAAFPAQKGENAPAVRIDVIEPGGGSQGGTMGGSQQGGSQQGGSQQGGSQQGAGSTSSGPSGGSAGGGYGGQGSTSGTNAGPSSGGGQR